MLICLQQYGKNPKNWPQKGPDNFNHLSRTVSDLNKSLLQQRINYGTKNKCVKYRKMEKIWGYKIYGFFDIVTLKVTHFSMVLQSRAKFNKRNIIIIRALKVYAA